MRQILIQSLQTGLLILAGDQIAQHLEKTRDYMRSARMFTFGCVVAGPAMSYWYFILSKLRHKNKPLELTMRVCLDQVLFSPISLGAFFLYTGFLKNENIQEKFKKSYKETIFNSWRVWPLVQIINFSIIPQKHRVLYVNTVALGWNTYVSRMLSA